MTSLRLATSESWKDQQSGQTQERTEWHRVVMYRRLAEIAGEYLKKGAKVYIEGSLRTRQWKGQDGSDRYTTEIVANEMQMLDRAGAGGMSAGASSGPDWDEGPQVNEQRGGSSFGGRSSYGGKGSSPGPASREPEPDFDDDIPF